jgi:HSP20 family protein
MSARGPRSPQVGTSGGLSWDPIHDLVGLKDRMNRLLENVLRKGDFETDVAAWSPAIDLREDEESYVLTAELPGVRRDNIAIRVEEGFLTLEGERPMGSDAKDADHLRVERSYGPFARTFALPGPVDEQKVAARLHLGVLEVFLPKAAHRTTRSIKIRVS